MNEDRTLTEGDRAAILARLARIEALLRKLTRPGRPGVRRIPHRTRQ